MWIVLCCIFSKILDARATVTVEDGPEVGLVFVDSLGEGEVKEVPLDFDNLCLWEKEKGEREGDESNEINVTMKNLTYPICRFVLHQLILSAFDK